MDFIKEPVSDKFTVGFSKKYILPDDIEKNKYYIAGYKMDHPVTGVHDPLTVRAMWLDCKDGGGIVLVSADIIGLTGYDVKTVRDSLSDFTKKTGCKLINIIVFSR